MTPEQFIYWLQGYMEIADPKQLDEKQTQIIKDHIALVLKKETPTRSFPQASEKSMEQALKDLFPALPKQAPLFDHGILCRCPHCTSKNLAVIC